MIGINDTTTTYGSLLAHNLISRQNAVSSIGCAIYDGNFERLPSLSSPIQEEIECTWDQDNGLHVELKQFNATTQSILDYITLGNIGKITISINEKKVFEDIIKNKMELSVFNSITFKLPNALAKEIDLNSIEMLVAGCIERATQILLNDYENPVFKETSKHILEFTYKEPNILSEVTIRNKKEDTKITTYFEYQDFT